MTRVVHATRRLAMVLVMTAVAGAACGRTGTTGDNSPPSNSPPAPTASAVSAMVDGADPIRLSGTVEAVQARTVTVPRLQGPFAPLVMVGLVPAGTRVSPGDPLVAFDRQQQERDAFDRRAELGNLDGDIQKKISEQAALEAKDQTELSAAEHDVTRAELDVRTNDLIPRIDAEKNTLALEQARARFDQLKTTYALKRTAAAADLEILEIRRDRAERALRYAEDNARLMEVRAPFAGLVVIRRVYRNGAFVEVAAGDEVRPGTPIVDIVDTSVMRVRARVNQADIGLVRAGQRARIGLDGFPDLVFDGLVEHVTPLATSSRLSQAVRSFTAVISIDGTHPQLLPDLTASVEIVPDTATSDVVALGSR
jgi:multidrug resistance efflux pump